MERILQVYYYSKQFYNIESHRATLVLHLYNWAPSMGDDVPGMSDVLEKLRSILHSAESLPSFTSMTRPTPPTSSNGGEQQSTRERFSAAGYQYVRSLGFFGAKELVRADA